MKSTNHCSHLDSSKSNSGSHLKSFSRLGKQLAFSFQIHLPYKCPPSFMHSFIHPSIHSFIRPQGSMRTWTKAKNSKKYQNLYISMISRGVHFVAISPLFWKHHIQAVSSPSSQKSPSSCHHLDHTHLGSHVGFRIQWPTVLVYWMARSCVLGNDLMCWCVDVLFFETKMECSIV